MQNKVSLESFAACRFQLGTVYHTVLDELKKEYNDHIEEINDLELGYKRQVIEVLPIFGCSENGRYGC